MKHYNEKQERGDVITHLLNHGQGLTSLCNKTIIGTNYTFKREESNCTECLNKINNIVNTNLNNPVNP